MIVSNESLRLEEEDSLMKFILEVYSIDRKYGNLFEYVIFNNVKEETLSEFVQEFDIADLNSGIWIGISKRLLSTVKFEEVSERYKECAKIISREHREGDKFNGLLRYLNDRTGGNIHDNGTINITSNSIYSDIYHFKSDISDCYVCFDFKERRIQVTSYSIKSYNGNQNEYNLKNWTIEISNDGTNWTKIDEHQNDATLNGKYITGTFQIQKEHEFSRFIRLHQTGKNWRNDYFMILSCFDIYGKLKEPISKPN